MRVTLRSVPVCRAGMAALAVILPSLIGGCAPQQTGTPAARPQVKTEAIARPRAARVESVGKGQRLDAQQTAILRVSSQPLYRQAQQACKAKQYVRAARLLERLESMPELNSEARDFARQQRLLCLKDAGLPLPAPHPVVVSSPKPSSRVGAVSPDAADCGPRALLLLCRKEGVAADLPRLRQLAETTQEGTSLAGLEKAAKAVGLKTRGVQVSREVLPDVDMPAVAYVNGNHFLAVLSVQGRGEDATATVHDPNSPREQTIPQERLLRLCSGYLLLAHR